MVDQRHSAVGETRPQLEVQSAFRRRWNGPRHGHAIHILGAHLGQVEAHFDGFFGQLASGRAHTPRQFRFLHRRQQVSIAQNGAGSVAQNPTDSQKNHFFPCCAFSILAQVSRSPTVRLKTSLSGVESLSTQK